MAKTARNLVTDALRTLGVVDAISTPSAEEIGHGLNEFNNLVATLDLDNLYPYTSTINSGALIAGQNIYTIGTSADINTTRPNSIQTFAIEFGGVYRPLEFFNSESFDDRARELDTTGIPYLFTYRSDFPFSKIEIYPTPDSNYNFTMTSKFKQLEYGLNDTIDLPSGYYPMLQYNLALLLNIHYPNPAKYQMLQERAVQMLGAIKRLNSKPRDMKSDYPSRSGGYDVYSDSYVR